MSTNEVLSLYKGEGKFKDCDFQKRQQMYKEQNELKTGEEGALSVKEQYNKLKGLDEAEEKIGRFQSANKMDELNLTEDIKVKEIFLVTRELQDGNDSYEVYEVYDKDGNILLKTDKDRNIIAEQALKDLYSPEQIKELEDKVLMRIMKRDPKTGEMKDCVGVSDKLDQDKEVEKMKENRDSTIYSEIKDSDEKDDLRSEEALTEEQIEEKTGGHIIDIIEDPNFYQIIPFAKYRTYLVEEGGQYKFVDGQGNEIKGMQEENREVFVDDENTKNIQEKQMSDIVFSTGRNDDDIVIAIKNGKIHVVDVENDVSEQLETAGYDVTEKEQEETRKNITERDEVNDVLGDSDVTIDFLEDFLRRECRSFSNSQVQQLYENCKENNIRKNDIGGLRAEINKILEERENEGREDKEAERDRGERTTDTSEDEKTKMKRLAGLN